MADEYALTHQRVFPEAADPKSHLPPPSRNINGPHGGHYYQDQGDSVKKRNRLLTGLTCLIASVRDRLLGSRKERKDPEDRFGGHEVRCTE